MRCLPILTLLLCLHPLAAGEDGESHLCVVAPDDLRVIEWRDGLPINRQVVESRAITREELAACQKLQGFVPHEKLPRMILRQLALRLETVAAQTAQRQMTLARRQEFLATIEAFRGMLTDQGSPATAKLQAVMKEAAETVAKDIAQEKMVLEHRDKTRKNLQAQLDHQQVVVQELGELPPFDPDAVRVVVLPDGGPVLLFAKEGQTVGWLPLPHRAVPTDKLADLPESIPQIEDLGTLAGWLIKLCQVRIDLARDALMKANRSIMEKTEHATELHARWVKGFDAVLSGKTDAMTVKALADLTQKLVGANLVVWHGPDEIDRLTGNNNDLEIEREFLEVALVQLRELRGRREAAP